MVSTILTCPMGLTDRVDLLSICTAAILGGGSTICSLSVKHSLHYERTVNGILVCSMSTCAMRQGSRKNALLQLFVEEKMLRALS